MFRVLSNYYKWVTYNFRCRLSSSVTSLSLNPDDDWVSLETIQVNKNSYYTEQQLKHSMTTGIGCENVYFCYLLLCTCLSKRPTVSWIFEMNLKE